MALDISRAQERTEFDSCIRGELVCGDLGTPIPCNARVIIVFLYYIFRYARIF
jgi:hypothetical protein